jgi:hypothetical protein
MTIRSDNADLRLTEKGEFQTMYFFARLLSLSAQSLNDESDARVDYGLLSVLARKAGVISDYRRGLLISTTSEMDRSRNMLKSVALSPQARPLPSIHPT